jgi:hypothetical protein
MSAPQRKPRDKKKFRDQYLANLQLENANNQLNLNASKMYASTGASSQQATQMTATEKFSGLEGLKQIAKDFMVSNKFLNPFAAADAGNMFTPEEITFINQYSQFMATDFKGRNVPAQIFVNYVRKLLEKLSKTEGVDYGLQQTSGSGVLLSEEPIYTQEDFDYVEYAYTEKGYSSEIIKQMTDKMKDLAQFFSSGLTDIKRAHQGNPITEDRIQELYNIFKQDLPTAEYIGNSNFVQAMNALGIFTGEQREALDNLYAELSAVQPSQLHSRDGETGGTYVNEQMDYGVYGFSSGRFGASTLGDESDVGLASQYTTNALVEQKIAEFEQMDMEGQLQEFERIGITVAYIQHIPQDQWSAAYRQHLTSNPALANPPAAPFQGSVSSAPTNLRTGVTPNTTPNDLTTSGAASATAPTPIQSSAESTATTKETSSTAGKNFQESQLLRLRQDLEDVIQADEQQSDKKTRNSVAGRYQPYVEYCELYGADPKLVAQAKQLITQISKSGVESAPETHKNIDELQSSTRASNTGSGFKHRGRGIGRKTPLQRSDGYKKTTPYKQLGKYLIHRHKLEDGIVMIKTPGGAKIKSLPTQSVSPQLREVLKVMADGGKPQYHHVQGLGLQEKEKFHHIVKHTQADLEVPSPHKETADREMTRFDILRGEIGAGNDNHEMIREFKSMLLKFIREGRIPRREGSEVMEELMMMGH